jgi:hypothetical protein
MSTRVKELQHQHEQLRRSSAAEREEIAHIVQGIEERLHGVGRAVGRARAIAKHPLVIIAGIGLFFAIGPARFVRLAGRAAVLAATARKLRYLRR